MDVIRLTPDRSGAVVEVLCAAFRDYPVMRYVLLDAGDAYDDHLRRLIGYFTESRFVRGYPVLGIEDVEGRLIAAANLDPPQRVPEPPALARSFESLSAVLGAAAIARFEAFADASAPLSPSGSYHYLGMIGVVPEQQGRGLARRLLEHVHRLSDAAPDSRGVCLTTELAANVPLYEHFGYRVLGEAVTDDGKLRTWTMFRDGG